MADLQNSGFEISSWFEAAVVRPSPPPTGMQSPQVWCWIACADGTSYGNVATYGKHSPYGYPYLPSDRRRTHWAWVNGGPAAGGAWFDASISPVRPKTTDIYPRVWVWVRHSDDSECADVGAYNHVGQAWTTQHGGDVIRWAWMRSPYEHPTPIDQPSDLENAAAGGVEAQAAEDIEVAIAKLEMNRSKLTLEQSDRVALVLGKVIASQHLLDDLLEASDRISKRVEKLLKPGEEVDIRGAAYAMGQLSGLHIAISCLEIDDAYMKEEGDEDSPIKFVGISRAYLFEEANSDCPDLRTSDGKSWERAAGESWESEFNCDYLTQSFERWRDRINQVALGDG